MTASGALPTREAIAEIIESYTSEWTTPLARPETLAMAEAILARLRPAGEQAERWKLVAETKGSMHKASTCTHAIEANRLREGRNALRADLERAQKENRRLEEQWNNMQNKWIATDADLRACAEALMDIRDVSRVHSNLMLAVERIRALADAALARPGVKKS